MNAAFVLLWADLILVFLPPDQSLLSPHKTADLYCLVVDMAAAVIQIKHHRPLISTLHMTAQIFLLGKKVEQLLETTLHQMASYTATISLS